MCLSCLMGFLFLKGVKFFDYAMKLNKKMVDFQHGDSKLSSTNILIKFIKIIKNLGVFIRKNEKVMHFFGNNITLHRSALLDGSFID